MGMEAARAAFLEALESSEADRIDTQLSQLADLLPEPDGWMTLGRGDYAVLLLLAGKAQFKLTVHGKQLSTISQRVRIAQIKHQRSGSRTTWEFQLPDWDDPLEVKGGRDESVEVKGLKVIGRVKPGQPESFDQAEAFARALAALAGWTPTAR